MSTFNWEPQIEQLKAQRQALTDKIAEIDIQIDRAVMNTHLGVAPPEIAKPAVKAEVKAEVKVAVKVAESPKKK